MLKTFPPFRLLSYFLATLVVITSLVSCNQELQTPLKFGSNIWPGYEPVYMARELGMLPEDEIKLVEFSSTTQALRAFRNGEVDVIGTTLDEALLLHSLSPKILAVFDISDGADVIMSRTQTMKQLTGKRIGVENTALGAFILTRALQLHDMKLSDITVVPVQIHEHEAFYKQSRVDAVVTFEPVRSKLLAVNANEIFTSKEIPNEIVDVMLVSRKAIKNKQVYLKKLLDTWYKSRTFLKNKPREAGKIMSKRLKISAQEVIASYDSIKLPGKEESLSLLTGSHNNSLRRVASRLKEVMEENRLVESDINIDTLFMDDSQLKAFYQ